MSAAAKAFQRQAEIVDKLQDRILREIESGKPDELRNTAVALGIAMDKLYMRPTQP